MYAISTVSLSLIWGALNVLNMAQGALLTFGGYIAYAAVFSTGLDAPLAILASALAGGLFGTLMYLVVVRQMLNREGFEVNVIIATVGIGSILEAIVQKVFGAYPIRQPLTVEGGFFLGKIYVPYNSVMIVIASAGLMFVLAAVLARTRMGRAIRAVSQNRDAARLMGVPVHLVVAQG